MANTDTTKTIVEVFKISNKISVNLKQPHIRAKIIGLTLILIGIIFLLLTNTSLYIKLGFASIIIGLLLIFIITEKTIPKNLSDAQIKGNLETIKNITKNLNLNGNAMFLPANNIRSEERIFIPLNKTQKKLPEIDNDYVFSTGSDGKSLGIAVPPSGLELLKEIEKQVDFKEITLDDVEEPLQSFVGLDLLRSISLEKQEKSWMLNLEKPIFCTKDPDLCNQYPCPTCSAVLTAITRAAKQNIQIEKTTHNGKKIAFQLKIGEQKDADV